MYKPGEAMLEFVILQYGYVAGSPWGSRCYLGLKNTKETTFRIPNGHFFLETAHPVKFLETVEAYH